MDYINHKVFFQKLNCELDEKFFLIKNKETFLL